MNWINPRDRMPEKGQRIWILCIEENRSGYTCAECHIAEVSEDVYGVIYAEKINAKGFPHGRTYYFYEWDHRPIYYGKYWGEMGLLDIEYSDSSITDAKEALITAWCPFEGTPIWENIGVDESKAIIQNKEKYKAACEIDKNKKVSQFIKLSDHKPENGVYVVANEGGIFLSRYEKILCDPWIAPNRLPVVAWYPIPDGY